MCENPENNIEAIQINTHTARQMVCWNCKLTGHSFVDCISEQRNVFCFRCGFDNVITPKCPRCRGNDKTNMSKTGQACSDQHRAQLERM